MTKVTPAASFQKLSLDAPEAIAVFPPPEQSTLDRVKPAARRAVTAHAWELMAELLKTAPAQLPSPVDMATWCRLFLVCSAYYVAGSISDIKQGLDTVPSPPGFNLAALKALAGEVPHELAQQQAMSTLASYVIGGINLSLLKPMSIYPTGPRPVIETALHEACVELAEEPLSFGDESLVTAAGRALRALLRATTETYGAIDVWNKAHPFGPFSSLRPGELGLLAERDESMRSRYGDAELEKVFEQQLALTMQSLGFYVVSTRRGERTVDLVYISSDPTEPLTALIEAKTSKARYALPTADERAILEYVSETRRSLKTLPPLRFVLIVGASAAKTLGPKLVALEAKASVPVRFASAQSVASFREHLAGPAPMRVVTESILTGDHVLSDDFGEAAAKRFDADQKAHETFVRSMYGLGPSGEESEPTLEAHASRKRPSGRAAQRRQANRRT